MKEPGPDHPITLTPIAGRTEVVFHGHILGSTERAISLKEADYPAVTYVPREDLDMALLHRTEHSTHCPYKGDASYFSLMRDGDLIENAAWSYEAPFPAMSAIRGMVAFYPKNVEFRTAA